MARLVGNQSQEQEFQVAGSKHPRSASTAFSTGTFFKTITTVAVVSEVRAVVMGVIV
jgi:hypothetical protein